MFAVTKIKRVPGRATPGTMKCVDCGKKATKLIGQHAYCAHCGDNLLLRTIKLCVNAVEEAVVKIKIIPKGALRARKESPVGS